MRSFVATPTLTPGANSSPALRAVLTGATPPPNFLASRLRPRRLRQELREVFRLYLLGRYRLSYTAQLVHILYRVQRLHMFRLDVFSPRLSSPARVNSAL